VSKTLKWIIFSLVGLIILLLILKKAGIIGKDETVKVTSEKVLRRTITETVNSSGKIYPETELKITSDVSGEVSELNVQEGDSVKKGQVLAHISGGTITSPIAGTVILINVKKGERVVGSSMMAGTEVMRIADLSKFEIRVDVGENDILKIVSGDTAIVEVDAYNNKKFKGIVTQIANSTNSSSALQSQMSTDVTNYKVHIHLLPESYKEIIDSTKGFLFRPGMSASADIQTKTHEKSLSVAINAVTTRDKNDSLLSKNYSGDKTDDATSNIKNNPGTDDLDEVVFVLQKDATVKKVKVKTGIQDINYIEILDGINQDDEVITGPYEAVSKTLKNEMKVKIVSKSELFDKKK
jgi:HlyD family secretion protein